MPFDIFGMKKGQFFSLITMLMVLPLIALSVSFSGSMTGYGEEIGSLVKLKSSYYYHNSVSNDLVRAGEIVGKRSVVSALNHVVDTGESLNSSETTLRELFTNGSINSTDIQIMNGSTIYHWFNRTEDISGKRGYDLNLELRSLDVTMDNPFYISFIFNHSLGLSDRSGLFSLKRSTSKSSDVSIQDVEDPLVTLRTEGKLAYKVDKSNYGYFTRMVATGRGNNSWSTGESVVLPSDEGVIYDVDDRTEKILVTETNVSESLMDDFAGVVIKDNVDMSGYSDPYVVNIGDDFSGIKNGTRLVVEGNESEVWDIGNLYSTWANKEYFGVEGPSFLDRLENELDNSYEGAELGVFLRKEDLNDAGLGVRDRPNLAHIYFSGETVENYRVKGMPPTFKVSGSNLNSFNLDNTLSFR